MINFFFKLRNYLKIFKTPDTQKGNIKSKNIHIDLSCETNHLGDTLIFTPLVFGLIDQKFNVTANDPYGLINKIFKIKKKPQRNSLKIGRSNKFANHKKLDFNINFYSMPNEPIAKGLFKKFLEESEYSNTIRRLKGLISELGDCQNLKPEITQGKFVIFAPEINSRKFGFYPSQKSTRTEIKKQILSMKKEGYKIILIGSSKDKYSEKFGTNMPVDYDLRGETKWHELIYLINHENFHMLITFDTFPYHLACILNAENMVFSRSWINQSEYFWIKGRFIPAFIDR